MTQSTRNISSKGNGQAKADRRNEPASPLKRARRGPIKTWRVVYSVTTLVGLVAVIAGASATRDATSSTLEADSAALNAVPVIAFQTNVVASYPVTRSYTGMIVARRKTDLGFELPGKIVQVLFDVGDEVNEGAPLAALDVEHLKTRREELIARQAQAQSVLDELATGPRKETIGAAQAEVSRIASQTELLEIQYNRLKRLLEKKAVARDKYDVARYSLEARRAEFAAAKYRLNELTNGTRPEQIAAQEAALKQLSVQIVNVEVDLEKSVLRAPFAGRISARFVDEGKVVQAGTPVFQLLEAHVLEAWIGVPPQEARRLHTGDKLPVNVEGEAYKARVSGILPTVDRGTHTQTVILDLPEFASQAVAEGQMARLQLETRVAEEGMWVPTTALEKGSRGLWCCYVLEDGHDGDRSPETYRIARRYVELLHSDGARAFVRGTIGPGEKIVSGGTHRIVPGQLVRIGKEV